MTISSANRISISLIALFFSITLASAGILETKPSDKAIEGVKLAKEAVFQSEGKPITLKPYASGLRKKKVALFWAKVYVGQIFAPAGLNTPPASMDEALATLAKQPVVALSMTFLRDVGASRQKDGFIDSLQINGIDATSEAFKPLLDAVEKGGDAKDTFATTLIFERRKDGAEWIYYENGKGELQSMSFEKGMIAKILSIWVGKPADSGMERLHTQFLGKED